MYSNGNKQIINLKTLSSVSNSKKKFVRKNRHVIVPLFWSLLDGYGQVDSLQSLHCQFDTPCLATFYTFYILIQKKTITLEAFKRLMEKLQENINNGKKVSMKHQNPILCGVAKVGGKFWMEKSIFNFTMCLWKILTLIIILHYKLRYV